MAEEKLAVYLMDRQGNYDEPIWLPVSEVAERMHREARKYHEIRVVDADDKLCLQLVEGKVVFPRTDILFGYLQRQGHPDS